MNNAQPSESHATAESELPASVVVIDDDRTLGRLLRRWLEDDGYQVAYHSDGRDALDGLGKTLPDAVCLDLNMPGLSGLDALGEIRSLHPGLPVIILTVDDQIDSVVQAMRLGAYDYLIKPIQRHDLSNRLQHAVESHQMSLRLAQLERDPAGGFPGIIGSSDPMRLLYRQMQRLANSDITVLIHGESGTGKELVAHTLHRQSARAEAPFVAVNCAAIPENLQESELFGHEKGAFTGADAQRIGRFEQAHRGTLFLDEIAELSASAQAKLLRVLQERSFTRVGGSMEIASEFRLIAATHRDLAERVREGRFREDLYFRVAVFEVEVPPLRQRIGDIAELVDHFLAEYTSGDGEPVGIERDALRLLMAHRWPGNVRELQNAIQRAVVAADEGGPVGLRHLPPRLLEELQRSASRPAEAGSPVPPAEREVDGGSGPILPLREVERRAILQAVDRFEGNLSEVGRQLGIGRTTLYRKLRQYGVR